MKACENILKDMGNIVVGIGEVLWDILPDGNKNLGGAPANFAYHIGQFGLESMVISAVGKDTLADETRSALEAKGLHGILQEADYPTGTVLVTLDNWGVPSYNIREGVAWDNILFTPALEKAAQACRAVCFGSLAQRSAVSRDTILRFVRSTPESCMRIFDINLRQNFYAKEIVEESLKLCNVLKINEDELVTLGRMLYGIDLYDEVHCRGFEELIRLRTESGKTASDVCKYLLRDYSLDNLILTCGADGSYIYAPHLAEHQSTPKVEAVDTVGAGDSFTAAFCAARLSGLSVWDSQRLAVNVSAYVCTQHGAMPALPASLADTTH